MALDMEQLRKMFYDECRENLEILENNLLHLDCSQLDKETIDTIFRAAHSIKGGAATFNFSDISEFTHDVEAYLDAVRNQMVSMNTAAVDLLLRSCDYIAELLASVEVGQVANQEKRAQLSAELAALLITEPKPEEHQTRSALNALDSPETQEPSDTDAATWHWQVHFSPYPSIFYSGNDPLRILRELTELDQQSQLVCHKQDIISLEHIDPELCYLRWVIDLSSSVSREAIDEVFEWVEDECELVITQQPVPLTPEAALSPAPHQSVATNPACESKPQVAAPALTTTFDSQDTPARVTHTQVSTNDNSITASMKKPDGAMSSIRVDIEKVDNLINLVGELVITQSMLTEIGNDFSADKLEKLKSGLEQLLQNSKDLQENVLNIRMLPMSFAFSRFPRLVRDLTQRLGKEVKLTILGEHTELDKTVLERIVDPLVHLVRNAIDHGIESPEERVRNGKSAQGVVTLNAYHQGGNIVIVIEDDGHGLDCEKLWHKAQQKQLISPDTHRKEMSDKQVMALIFAPGFSTAESVSDISGRGVGMDVVRRNIEELGGYIDVDSTLGKGCTFTINLPLTLAILDGQLVKVGAQVYVIPLLTIIESIQVDRNSILHASGGIELYRLREETIPILRLHDALAISNVAEKAADDSSTDQMREDDGFSCDILCVVESAGHRVGLLLDELHDQQQVVIKSLESNYTKVAGISGATILGDGSVSLIIDVQGLVAAFVARHTKHRAGVAA
ncbi:chemotaxis protein CheA [Vibrio sp. SM6]|uniref:Chemotaxis protein CheA n=1 Tax=Vibrio agarilyticus TaxID=2726741 RepID=A0A7X8TNC8_9VIBR|nr:chemotaxis protein CheA [Vibrio agarilyticus]NLS11930.1 chemotaxis protein CheA [Vibrio agarilyticus]